jgi:hypothetical protein
MNLKLDRENCPPNLFSVARLTIALLAAVGLCLASPQGEDEVSLSIISEDEASQMIKGSLIKNLTESSRLEMGLRVNQYPELLDSGTMVREANPDELEPSRVLFCRNASWLFFIDLAPGAHFAHPVIIAVLDALTGDIQYMDGQWWPVIIKPAFDSETKRRDPETIIFEKVPNI